MSNAHLYGAVREAAAGVFDVLGELGAGPNGGVVYLAREIDGDALVVLKLEPGDDAAGGTQYFLDVARELDASVPDVELRCPRCPAKLRQWARFCTQCGLDVSGEAPSSGEHASRMALREKVRAATAGAYEFLGDIPRSEGGGLVYFARDLSDGKIVALRLQKDLNKKFEVGVTRTLKAFEREKLDRSDREGSVRPAVTIVQRSPFTRAGAVPTPGPRGAAPVPPGGLASARGSAPSAKAAGKASPRTDMPNAASARKGLRQWKIGRAEIALAVAIALIVILILTRS